MPEFRISVATVLLLLVLSGCAAPASPDPLGLPANPPRPATCTPPTSTDLTTAPGWLNRIASAPGTVGLVVDDGRGRVVSHEATTPFPLASAVKVVHLAAYARAVTDGRIRPDEPVARADWERWYVPGTDGGVHPEALARLGNGPTDTADQVVSAMIRESDNAAADWLRGRLGDEALREAAASAGWADVDLPSFVGATARFALPDRASAGAGRAQIATIDAQLGRQVADDPAFRVEVQRRYAAAAEQDPERFLADQQRWTDTTAAGTPVQLLRLHRAIATGTVPGADIVRRQLTYQGPTPGLGTIGFKAGSFVDVVTFGSFVRRDDGSLGYAVVLGRDLPLLPLTGTQARGQQTMALDALRSPAGFDRLLCVA
ncbi:class A beta-lactamase-related serine hydrolase [Actinomycetospora endophytica]|uniref:Class A beta-lactamase-related serine hydrolase n=1 Tax=Actinomycetospora endophytica TaxID=2291215 RepID=A0ABS8P6D1_9PSEU|nr:serine hydrolase [Actinomycetospora endophytica]MCD2193573.1 class A beta-lactamase-related serine hydrolase [Actinomycetospora endophytica]